jgi:selenide, water dikinase
LSQAALTQVLRQLPISTNGRVLVNSNTFDDAGVYRLDRHRALVQTVDFFTPIVDDPFTYGQIAAANALSDVFAMGGRPITALNVMGFPTNLISPKTITTILRGGLEKAREAGCAIIGGHTIRNPEPIYGLAVTGIVELRNLMTNANARPNDLLVLTKPLGTGIATTAIKRGLASRRLQRKVISLMSQINAVGAELATKKLVRAAVDVTGFGLVGHVASLCRASKVSAIIDAAKVPPISAEVIDLISRDCLPGGSRDNFKQARQNVDWQNTPQPLRILLTDAQTSGGLLLCVKPRHLSDVMGILKKFGAPLAAPIGEIVRRRTSLICIKA